MYRLISDPTSPNKVFVGEIITKKAEFESASRQPLNVEHIKHFIVYNVFIVHDQDLDLDLDIKYNCSKTVIFHKIKLEEFSYRDAELLRCLSNRRLVAGGDVQLLANLLGVLDEHIQQAVLEPLPSRFFNSSTTDTLDMVPPPQTLLDTAGIVKFSGEEQVIVEEHSNKSGFFFLAGEYCLRGLYGNVAGGEEEERALSLLGLRLPYFSCQGEQLYSERVTPLPGSPPAPNQVLVRVQLYSPTPSSQPLNVSRFAVPMLCSRLVEMFLLKPGHQGILLIDPTVALTFSIANVGSGDFITFNLEMQENKYALEINRFILSLLKQVILLIVYMIRFTGICSFTEIVNILEHFRYILVLLHTRIVVSLQVAGSLHKEHVELELGVLSSNNRDSLVFSSIGDMQTQVNNLIYKLHALLGTHTVEFRYTVHISAVV